MKNLASLTGLTGLESLQITQGNVTSLHGVEGLVSLKRLWIEGVGIPASLFSTTSASAADTLTDGSRNTAMDAALCVYRIYR